MEYLEFTFKSFWTFMGVLILLNSVGYLLVNATIKLFSRLIRMVMVLLRGWPGEHLDADGDSITEVNLKYQLNIEKEKNKRL